MDKYHSLHYLQKERKKQNIMNIIIVGCGKVGYALSQQLNEEGHDITLIDKSAERLQPAIDNLDIQGFVGNGTSFLAQKEAGIESADLLIAVTDEDEINLISCVIAKKAEKKCRTIARVRNPEYFSEIEYLKSAMGISLVINPEYAAAQEIARLIQFPEAMDIDSFAKGRVDLLRVVLPKDSSFDNMKVFEFSKKFKHEVLICILEHEHQFYIPNGNSILHAGDSISVIMPRTKIAEFCKKLHLSFSHDVKNVMIAGGGTTAYYLAQLLLRSGIQVKIVEKEKERSRFLSLNLPRATVFHADATIHENLLESGLAKMDAFISLTRSDEANIFLSLYANKIAEDCKKITKINKMTQDDIIEDLPIGSVISTRYTTTEYILQYIRSQINPYGSNVEALYRLVDNRVEALEFYIREDGPAVGIPLANLKLKDNLLICCIVRGKQIITPSGKDTLELNDTVIVVTTHKCLQTISDIIRK